MSFAYLVTAVISFPGAFPYRPSNPGFQNGYIPVTSSLTETANIVKADLNCDFGSVFVTTTDLQIAEAVDPITSWPPKWKKAVAISPVPKVRPAGHEGGQWSIEGLEPGKTYLVSLRGLRLAEGDIETWSRVWVVETPPAQQKIR